MFVKFYEDNPFNGIESFSEINKKCYSRNVFFKCKLHYITNESNIFAYESSFNVYPD